MQQHQYLSVYVCKVFAYSEESVPLSGTVNRATGKSTFSVERLETKSGNVRIVAEAIRIAGGEWMRFSQEFIGLVSNGYLRSHLHQFCGAGAANRTAARKDLIKINRNSYSKPSGGENEATRTTPMCRFASAKGSAGISDTKNNASPRAAARGATKTANYNRRASHDVEHAAIANSSEERMQTTFTENISRS